MKVATKNIEMIANGANMRKSNPVNTNDKDKNTPTTNHNGNNPTGNQTEPYKKRNAPTINNGHAWKRSETTNKATNTKNPTGQQINNINNNDNTMDKQQLNKANAAKDIMSKWNITVKPTAMNEEINIKLIVEGILQAVQLLHPPAWINATDGSPDGILNINELPPNKNDLNKYVEDIRTTYLGKVTFRLTFTTNIPMEEIVFDKTFKQWLRDQKMFMEISELQHANPLYVGFLDTPLPEHRKLPLMKARFDNAYPTEKGKFQVVLAPISIDGQNYTSTFYMIVCNQPDLEHYQLLFQNAEEKTGHVFFPWNQFQSCKKSQKIEVVKQQQYYYATHRTTLLYNFTDANPPIKTTAKIGITPTTTNNEKPIITNNQYDVLSESMEQEEAALQTDMGNTDNTQSNNPNADDNKPDTTEHDDGPFLTEFIYDNFRNCYNEHIFEIIYPPINNIIETIHKKQQTNEINALLPYLHNELALNMTDEAIEWGFTYPTFIKSQLIDHPRWKPFYLGTSLPESAVNEKPTKKQRHIQKQNQKRKQSATITYNAEKIENKHRNDNTTINTTEITNIPFVIRTPTTTTISTQTTTSVNDLVAEINNIKEFCTTKINDIENNTNTQIQQLTVDIGNKFEEQETRIIGKINIEMEQRDKRNMDDYTTTMQRVMEANNQQLCAMMAKLTAGQMYEAAEVPEPNVLTKRPRNKDNTELLLTQESDENIDTTGTAPPVGRLQSWYASKVSAKMQ
jgi:hypothetical protein